MVELANADKLLRCNVVDCRPSAEPAASPSIPRRAQAIDYMAKDFDSLLRAMVDLIPSRVPGWKDRTEADLGMALLELFAYLGDQLSYYQDRIANEAWLRTATQRDSVRRLLALIDYTLDTGASAQVLLAVAASATTYVPAGFTARTDAEAGHAPLIFEIGAGAIIHPELNAVALAQPAPSNPERTQAVLSGVLDLFLAPGSWLWFESMTHREWGRLAAPPVANAVLNTTTVTLEEPLAGDYLAGSILRGNGVEATHGESHQETTAGTGLPHQTIVLPHGPLTYLAGPDSRSVTTLGVEVDGEPWIEVEDFIDSTASQLHYRVTLDNDGFATVRFGDGRQGSVPESGAVIVVRYRVGIGEAGLAAPGTLTEYVDPSNRITSITNPLATAGAREPESLADARLLGPRTLRRQNRAVTRDDYAHALVTAEGSGYVRPLHARARYRDTGSWTTVFVSVEMPERRPLAATPRLAEALRAVLETRRQAGYDVHLEDARYAPLHIGLLVHVKSDFFARHVRQAVERVLGNGVLPGGRPAFFAPGRLGLGQSVYLSDLYATALTVEGVESLSVTRFKRLGDRYPERRAAGFIDIDPLEIARCDNDRDHPENGIHYVRTCGGKEG